MPIIISIALFDTDTPDKLKLKRIVKAVEYVNLVREKKAKLSVSLEARPMPSKKKVSGPQEQSAPILWSDVMLQMVLSLSLSLPHLV